MLGKNRSAPGTVGKGMPLFSDGVELRRREREVVEPGFGSEKEVSVRQVLHRFELPRGQSRRANLLDGLRMAILEHHG